MLESWLDYLKFKLVWKVGILSQVVLIVILFGGYTLLGYDSYLGDGLIFGYPALVSIFYMPVVEEVIFRGFILGSLVQKISARNALILSSILFGVFHLKNIIYIEPSQVMTQILYTGLIVGPILAWVTYKSKSIWPAVILHYLHNILAFGVVVYL